MPQLQITIRYKSQIIPETEKNFSEISEFSNFPYAEYENSEISEISLTLPFNFALKQSRKACKQLPQLQITVRYKIQNIPEAEKNLSEISEFSNFP